MEFWDRAHPQQRLDDGSDVHRAGAGGNVCHRPAAVAGVVWDAPDKWGANRQEIEVPRCFVPLVRWVLAGWAADQPR
ncbi:MAG TPA: hypothetical protein VHO69_18070 [Phototrophicaceae bacterium]|nr:hypothetical protein [Phototrophicaceae bacterium]